MIVVLCEDFDTAVLEFRYFLDFLNLCAERVLHIYESANAVETDDNLRYIFIDHKFYKIFLPMKPDFVDIYDFIDEKYGSF